MISFVRSVHAEQRIARRNHGIQERRVRLMQLGERAYLCQEFGRRCGSSAGQNETMLCLRDLSEMELREFLAQAECPPSRTDLARSLEKFATELFDSHNTSLVTLYIPQRIQDLLEEVDRESLLKLISGLLNLRHFSIGTVTVGMLDRMQTNSRRIESLEAACFHVNMPEEEQNMVRLLSKWTSLKCITWKTTSYLRAAQIHMLGQVAQSLPILERVHLAHSGLKEFHPFDALRFVQLCPSLQVLVLSSWKLRLPACKVLAGGIESHPSLEKLELSRCEIHQEGWNDHLLIALQTNQSLRTFSFKESRIVQESAGCSGSTSRFLIWERFAVLLEDYNHTLQHVDDNTQRRVWRLLELNRSQYRSHLNDAKLGPRILSMASHSPRFLYSMLRNNVETLFCGGIAAY